jgi:hypothetical protein
MNDTLFSDWTRQLSDAIANALREFALKHSDEPVVLLAVDCHPWHGSVALAVLTAAEVAADELLADPAEMAAWKHYDFTRELSSWRPVAGLGRDMQTAYESGDRLAMTDAFLRACAAAVSSPQVIAALELLERIADFRVSVRHPDNDREFVSTG